MRRTGRIDAAGLRGAKCSGGLNAADGASIGRCARVARAQAAIPVATVMPWEYDGLSTYPLEARMYLRFALVVTVALGISCSSQGPSLPELDDLSATTDVSLDGKGWSEPVLALVYTEDRVPCEDRSSWRNLYWGDLHGHTLFSFDAQAYEVLVTPAEAYGFAQGQPVSLPPLDEQGLGSRTAKLERPLDFAAITDHSEFLGEIHNCTVPGSPGYDSGTCQDYRDPASNGAFQFGTPLSSGEPKRFSDICGEEGDECKAAAMKRWAELVVAADENSDRTATCRFTALPAYEYTNTTDISNLHRNVLFRNNSVPDLPITHFEAPVPRQLWEALDEVCLGGDDGCDVMVLPHNSNLSNGNMFYLDASLPASERLKLAELRARMEPLVEIFQHKGDSECRNGYPGNPDDPHCYFEKLRPVSDPICEDEPGFGGMRLWGCSHPLDFVRNVLKLGLQEAATIGVNPYPLGFIGSTDTHNGTLGFVQISEFGGHVGVVDDTPEERLGAGNETHDGIINNPGGLVAVWAVENSRDAIFEALRRREVYGTSGPRIMVRFFGGWNLATEGVCDNLSGLLSTGYRDGVPMGGQLLAAESQAPEFLVWAEMDGGTEASPGAPLERIQIVKGWVDEVGKTHEIVHDVAGADVDATVDTSSCKRSGEGHQVLCVAWSDPNFDPAEGAFYYPRILEVPTCRWSTARCNSLADADRPASCDGGAVPLAVQQRAWASPIYYAP